MFSNSIVKPGKTYTWTNRYFLDPKNEWSRRSTCAQTRCLFICFGTKNFDEICEESLQQHACFYKSRESKLQRFNSDFNIQLGMVCLQQNQEGSFGWRPSKVLYCRFGPKVGSKTVLTNGQLNKSDRSKYPIKTITWFLTFNSFITLGQIGILGTFYTMIFNTDNIYH